MHSVSNKSKLPALIPDDFINMTTFIQDTFDAAVCKRPSRKKIKIN